MRITVNYSMELEHLLVWLCYGTLRSTTRSTLRRMKITQAFPKENASENRLGVSWRWFLAVGNHDRSFNLHLQATELQCQYGFRQHHRQAEVSLILR